MTEDSHLVATVLFQEDVIRDKMDYIEKSFSSCEDNSKVITVAVENDNPSQDGNLVAAKVDATMTSPNNAVDPDTMDAPQWDESSKADQESLPVLQQAFEPNVTNDDVVPPSSLDNVKDLANNNNNNKENSTQEIQASHFKEEEEIKKEASEVVNVQEVMIHAGVSASQGNDTCTSAEVAVNSNPSSSCTQVNLLAEEQDSKQDRTEDPTKELTDSEEVSEFGITSTGVSQGQAGDDHVLVKEQDSNELLMLDPQKEQAEVETPNQDPEPDTDAPAEQPPVQEASINKDPLESIEDEAAPDLVDTLTEQEKNETNEASSGETEINEKILTEDGNSSSSACAPDDHAVLMVAGIVGEEGDVAATTDHPGEDLPVEIVPSSILDTSPSSTSQHDQVGNLEAKLTDPTEKRELENIEASQEAERQMVGAVDDHSNVQNDPEPAALEAESHEQKLKEEEAMHLAGAAVEARQEDEAQIDGQTIEQSEGDAAATIDHPGGDLPVEIVPSSIVDTSPSSTTQHEQVGLLEANPTDPTNEGELEDIEASQDAERQKVEAVDDHSNVQDNPELAALEAESHEQELEEEAMHLTGAGVDSRQVDEAQIDGQTIEQSEDDLRKGDKEESGTSDALPIDQEKKEGLPENSTSAELKDVAIEPPEGTENASMENRDQQSNQSKEPTTSVALDPSADDLETPQKQPDANLSPGFSRVGGISFAEAFGGKPVSPLASPNTDSVSELRSPTAPDQNEDMEKSSDTSLTAFGAAKSKRVASLISSYLEKATEESLPGDSVQLNSPSPRSAPSPPPPPTSKSNLSIELEAIDLPNIGSIRARFEDSARSNSSSPSSMVFGEAFRQKQRFTVLADRERQKEAKSVMHGFNEMMLNNGKQGSGEIDSSSLPKSFTFETSSVTDPSLGTCKVDYESVNYESMVFAVHRTSGMLLLTYRGEDVTSKNQTKIPGGRVVEQEFLGAAQQTGSARMQLQLASREAAAWHMWKTTGIDIRDNLERFTPAVLYMKPPLDSKGNYLLRNQRENYLYYFLELSDEDFTAFESTTGLTAPTGATGGSLSLKLSSEFSGFTYIKDPNDAAIELKEHGDPETVAALSLIMGQSAPEGEQPAKAKTYESSADSGKLDLSKGGPAESMGVRGKTSRSGKGGVTIAEDLLSPEADEALGIKAARSDGEADLKTKASTDTVEVGTVACCCGLWF